MKKKDKVRIGVGAGILTAVTLAAAGAYLLSDKKRRTKAKAWVAKAKTEAAKQIKKAGKLSQGEYGRIIDSATKHYARLHDVTAPELKKVAGDLKSEWARIQKDAKHLAKSMDKKPARKTARRKTKRARR